MILLHPGLALIDCADCCRRPYNFELGVPLTYKSNGRDLPYVVANYQPPCRAGSGCPKGTPETAHESELTEANYRTYQRYRQSRATGLTEREKEDPLLCANFSLIHGIVAEAESREQSDRLALAMMSTAKVKK